MWRGGSGLILSHNNVKVKENTRKRTSEARCPRSSMRKVKSYVIKPIFDRLVYSNFQRNLFRRRRRSQSNENFRRREYWKIYRGPGFLAVARFGSSPPPSVRKLSLFQSTCVSPVELTDGRGGKSQFIRRREILVLYKSFITLWCAAPKFYENNSLPAKKKKLDFPHLKKTFNPIRLVYSLLGPNNKCVKSIRTYHDISFLLHKQVR
jgi:hypothetical protein